MSKISWMGKTCFVPSCVNSSSSWPEKKFIAVPKADRARRDWFKAVGLPKPSLPRALFCCQDHFDMDKDVVQCSTNLHKKTDILLKNGVVPHLKLPSKSDVKRKAKAKCGHHRRRANNNNPPANNNFSMLLEAAIALEGPPDNSALDVILDENINVLAKQITNLDTITDDCFVYEEDLDIGSEVILPWEDKLVNGDERDGGGQLCSRRSSSSQQLEQLYLCKNGGGDVLAQDSSQGAATHITTGPEPNTNLAQNSSLQPETNHTVQPKHVLNRKETTPHQGYSKEEQKNIPHPDNFSPDLKQDNHRTLNMQPHNLHRQQNKLEELFLKDNCSQELNTYSTVPDIEVDVSKTILRQGQEGEKTRVTGCIGGAPDEEEWEGDEHQLYDSCSSEERDSAYLRQESPQQAAAVKQGAGSANHGFESDSSCERKRKRIKVFRCIDCGFISRYFSAIKIHISDIHLASGRHYYCIYNKPSYGVSRKPSRLSHPRMLFSSKTFGLHSRDEDIVFSGVTSKQVDTDIEIIDLT